jgi:4-amino-4-deoxy-L-arabinose transferase-like glycosyltransferase
MTRLALPLILLIVLAVHLVKAEPSEPFYNGDETRHVMTGIFVADALADGGYKSPREYAERYYSQYPALGLLVWPPGFYGVEGVTMLAFGRSYETARALALAYLLLACLFLYRIVRHTHDWPTAMIATLIFAFSREVFFHSRTVMLEVPTLAFVLMAMLYLERFLQSEHRRDLVWIAVACIFAGLHRYDAVLLLPLFAFRLFLAGRWNLLKRRDVLIAAVCVILTLAPFYGLAVWEIGSLQSSAARHGSDPTVVQASRFEQFTFLLATLWAQLGHVTFALSVVGVLLSFRKENRAKSAPYWSLILATLIFFAPLAEQETRHGIFWIPAWSLFAAAAIMELQRRWRRPLATLVVAVLVIGCTLYWTLKTPTPWLRGYRPAIAHALKETHGPGILLFDGLMSGTVVYELRTQDADRRLWLLRGDKIFAASRSDPSQGYIEWAADEAAILKLLDEVDADWILVEEPPGRFETPMARKLRTVLANHPERYVRTETFPVENSEFAWVDGVKLIAYKPAKPRPTGPRRIAIPMLWQGGKIEAVIPPR